MNRLFLHHNLYKNFRLSNTKGQRTKICYLFREDFKNSRRSRINRKSKK